MSYWEFLGQYGPQLLQGAFVTIQQTILAAIMAVLIALAVGMMRLSRNLPVRGTATVYIEIFRGTSLLVRNPPG